MKSYLNPLFLSVLFLWLAGCGGGTTTTERNDSTQQSDNASTSFGSESGTDVTIIVPTSPFEFVLVPELDTSSSINGSVALSWQAPTTNTNGSELIDLAGFYIYYGKVDGVWTEVIDIQDVTALTHTITQIATGGYYFTVSAYNQFGVESAKVASVYVTIN